MFSHPDYDGHEALLFGFPARGPKVPTPPAGLTGPAGAARSAERAFSMAITAWFAKVVISSICLSVFLATC